MRRVGIGRLALFASGDFAFNLYWQSVMLYLLYYYTEAIHVPVVSAAACYAAASGWDGIVSLLAGILLRRAGPHRLPPRRLLMLGIVPLGASFALVYLPPPIGGAAAIAWVLGGHMVFRTLYALTNIPYLAMSARVSARESDRTLVAGGRMLAGTLAAVAVALGTVPIGTALTGRGGSPAFLATALVFAVVASVILGIVALTYRDGVADRPPSVPDRPAGLWTVWRQPAFRWFAAATMLMILPIAVVDRTVLYYFTYSLGDEARGRLTLGAMMVVSGIAVPLWMAMARRVPLRRVWVAAIATCLLALIAFVAFDPSGMLPVQIFLVAMQAGAVGLSFVMWAFLPEVIDLGRRAGDGDAEALAYGWLALLQRIAIGLGTLLLGLGFGSGGIRAGGTWMRLSLTVVPFGFLALSGALMLLNPHARPTRRA